MAGHPDTLIPSGSLRALRELLPYLWPAGEWRMRTRVVLALSMLRGVQVDAGLRAGDLRACGRRARRGRARDGGGSSRGAHSRLRTRESAVARLRPAPRRALRARRPAGHPNRRPEGVPPPPRPVPALPPRPADRGLEPLDRTRHQGHRDAAALQPVQRAADRAGDCARLRNPLGVARFPDRRRHPAHGRRLHPVHGEGHRVEARVPAANERAGQPGQHPGHRQPAQLRDREVLRQRGARGGGVSTAPWPVTKTRRSKARPRSRC